MSEQNGSGCTYHIGMADVVACVVSYALNHSFWWALLHFFLGPFYLVYVVFDRTKEIVPALVRMFS